MAKLSPEVINKLPHRGRGIADFDRLGFKLVNTINAIYVNKPIKILEIGCGFAQMLVQIKALFGDKVQLYGFSKEPDSVNIEKAINVAHFMNTVSPNFKIDSQSIKFDFGDAGVLLPFQDNYFDLIISQYSIIYVEDKINLIRECNRVLDFEGSALLWTGFENYSIQSGYWTSLQVIRDHVPLNLHDFFSSLGVHYQFRPTGSIINLTKSINMNIDVVLASAESISAKDIPGLYGCRSIYEME